MKVAVRKKKNKYAHLAPTNKPYNARDKTYRVLPLLGQPNEVIPRGTTIMFHGRLYKTRYDTVISPSGAILRGIPTTYCDCELVRYIDGGVKHRSHFNEAQ
jgi:hypothetical protein